LGDCDGLQETLERALELDSTMGRIHYYLAMCIYESEGDATRAAQIANNEPLGFMHDTALAIAHRRLGDREKAQRHLDKLIENYGDSAAYQYGQIYAQWGETNKALAWLETAVQIRDPGALLTRSDALLDPLRGEPRFQQILESAGFR
jgi:tetratricopeptide (TPR) repeat protein